MAKPHPNHLQHPHIAQPYQPSDSDTPAPPQLPDFFSPDPRNTLPNMPPAPPPTRTNKALNLSVLQRHLPPTTSMDLIVPYAVVYIFSPDREGWEKSGIEGTLFVVRTRNRQQAQEREGFAVVVLNRRGLENFVLELKTSEEVELTEEYVIVRDNGEGYEDGEPKIYGLWIFEEEGGSTKGMRRMCGEVIVERAKRVEQRNEGLRKDGSADVEQPLQEEQNDGPDLMALLNGGGKQKGTTAPTTHQGMDEGQVNLLDLFKNAEDAR